MLPRLAMVMFVFAAGLLFGCAGPAREPAAAQAWAGDAYYLPSCPACGGMLGAKGETLDTTWRGRDLRFCGGPCRDRFMADPGQMLDALDRVIADDQRPWYPPGGSVVSGRALSPGIDVVVGNRLFRLADESERQRLLADTGSYVGVLDAAVIRDQAPRYGMPDKCPVQGDILASDTPIDIVIANRMIRVCCQRCVRVVRSRPSQYLAMVEYANRAAGEGGR